MLCLPNKIKNCLCGLIVILSATATVMAQAAANLLGDLSETREMQVVIIKGAKLPSLLGKTSANYSVMAVSGEALVAIPFQFDD